VEIKEISNMHLDHKRGAFMPAELHLDDAAHRKRRFRAQIGALVRLLEGGEGRPQAAYRIRGRGRIARVDFCFVKMKVV